MNKSNVDWKSDVLYPISLFSIACLILLLSSFSTKSSYENTSTLEASGLEHNAKASVLAECCERTVSNTKGCNGDKNYVFYLKAEDKEKKGEYVTETYYISSSSQVSWLECDDKIQFVATNLKANSGSGELIDLDITYYGLTTNPPSDSPKANKCFNPNTGAWKYFTETDGTFTSNQHGSYTVSERGAAFQIGIGANVEAASGNGASGWFNAHGGSNGYWIEGDVNVQLSGCSPINPPSGCGLPDLTSINGSQTGLQDFNAASVKIGNAVVTGFRSFFGSATPDEDVINNSQTNGKIGLRQGVKNSHDASDYMLSTYNFSQNVCDLDFMFYDLDREDEVVIRAFNNGLPVSYSVSGLGDCVDHNGNLFKSTCNDQISNGNANHRFKVSLNGCVDMIEFRFYNDGTNGSGGSYTITWEEGCTGTVSGCESLLASWVGDCDDPSDCLVPSNTQSCVGSISGICPVEGQENASCNNNIICIATEENSWDYSIVAASPGLEISHFTGNFLYPTDGSSAGGQGNSSSCPTSFSATVKFFIDNILITTEQISVTENQIVSYDVVPSQAIEVSPGSTLRVLIEGNPTSSSCDLLELAGANLYGCCKEVVKDCSGLEVDLGQNITICGVTQVAITATQTGASICSGNSNCNTTLITYSGDCNDDYDCLLPSSAAGCLRDITAICPTNGSSNASCNNDIICIASMHNSWSFSMEADEPVSIKSIDADFWYPTDGSSAGGEANSSNCPNSFDFKIKFYVNKFLVDTQTGFVNENQIITKTISPSSPITLDVGSDLEIIMEGLPSSEDCDLFELAGLRVNGCCNPVAPTPLEDNTFAWAGPGVANETGATIVVDEAGIYSVTITDCSGCTATDQIEVEINNPTGGINCPDPVTVNCQDSTEPSETGTATSIASCGDVTITYEDNLTGSCPQILKRTWKSTIVVPGSSECVPSLMAKWFFDNIEQGCLNGVQPLDAGVTATTINQNSCSNFSVSKVTGAVQGSSCVQGSGGSAEAAICIQDQDDEIWKDGDDDAAYFSATFGSGSQGELTTFCLKERASVSNENFGDNIPPRQFGVRVLKGNTEVFKEIGITTTSSWSSHCFEINDEFTDGATYTFQIMGYNSAQRNKGRHAWELDDFEVYACCGTSTAPSTQVLTCVQEITIIDTQDPTLTGVPADTTITCVDEIPAVPTTVGAEDNCGYETGFNEGDPVGSEPCDYTITRTWTVTDLCGNSTSQSQVITIQNDIAATASGDFDVCEGQGLALFGEGTGGCGDLSYSWTGPNGFTSDVQNPDNATASGVYSLTVTDSQGCSAASNHEVLVRELPQSGIIAQEQVCAGEPAQFTAISVLNDATYSWVFSGPATPATSDLPVVDVIWDDVPGNYTASLTVDKDGCISNYIHEITVTFEVIANAGPDTTICQGGTAILDGTDSQGNGFLWEVVTGDPTSIDLGASAGEATVSPLTTTTYRLKVDDVANNCTEVDEVTVFVDVNLNPIANAGEIQSICQGDKVTLDATGSTAPVSKPNTDITYFWSPANVLDDPTSATPMATISETTTFDLMVVSEDGCIDTSSVVVTVLPCDVSLEKTVSNDFPNVGETVTFTISVTNDGSLPLTGIEIQDNVPSGYSAISSISPSGSAAGNVITWSGISLLVGESSTVTFDAVVAAPSANTSYLNTAQITAMDQSDIDSDPANDDGDQSEDDEDNANLTPQIVDLSLIKSIDDATPSVGDVVTFTITISNAGPNDATGVAVTDAIPNGYINPTAIGGTVSGSDATWTGLSVPANGNTTVTLTAEVIAPVANTSYVNLAEVTAVDQFDPDSTPGNGADTNNNGIVGSEDPDGSQDPEDEDDGDDATLVPNGSIWGAVLEDTNDDNIGDSPIAGVTVTLKDATGNVVATAVTDADGKYDFLDLAPGDYTVEQSQPDGFDDVSDQDGSPDGDAGDSDTTVDDIIAVTVTPGEADMDNDFVEELLTSIWGDVTEDTDGDGLGDAPLAGITITLKDAAGNVLETAITDTDGKYDFVDLVAGDYIIEEGQPDGYRDVSDQDESPDGDAGDSDTTVDNSIAVTTTPGEADMDNDFVEEGLTSIWGDVTEDTNDDNIGDAPIAGVTITLKDAAGNVLETAITDEDGKYDFVGLPAGDYIVEQGQPDGFDDVSDQDESPDGDAGDSDTTVDNSIAVTTVANEADMDNDFVEELLTSIWGSVTEDTDGDGVGDAPLAGITVTLKDAAGNVLETAITDADGKYDFVGLPAGDYIVEEGQPDGYRDVSDQDGSPDGDAGDSDTTVDNSITVTTTPGEADMDNDFVDEGLTSIWGDVTEDTNDDNIGEAPIAGVTITLKDAAGNVLETAITDADGKYDFVGLPAGDYIVEQGQPDGYDNVSDQDESPDGDAGDSDTTVDNSIAVTTVANEADMDNDFIEELLTSISGTVTEDTDGDGIGDTPLAGVTVTLKDAAGNVIDTAVTDADGKYEFVGLPAGDYFIEQTQQDGYRDVSDQDGSPDGDTGDSDATVDNSIAVTTTPGEADMDNDFVDEGLTSIWGDVTEDTNDDNIGENPIPGVTITLKDAAGNVIDTDVTDADGKYDFVGLPAGDYIVEQEQPAGYDNVSDQDESPDGDAGDSDDTVDNSIAVTTVANEADMDNDFIEELLTSISGTVTEDTDGDGIGDTPLAGVTVTLKDAAGNVIDTAVTDADGKYEFVGLPAGDYFIEQTQQDGYRDVSDQDGSPDGDTGDSDATVDNSIAVTTTPGEADMDNDFVDEGLTSIWGAVTADSDNDGLGDTPIAGVTITLKDAAGNVLETALTDADGKYDFTGLPAGDYIVEESQPANYADVSDQDGSPDGDAGDSDTTVDNSISVTTVANEADMDNDFVEVLLTSIWGDVTEDIDGDGAGDAPIAGVTITLKDAAGNVLETAVTDADGKYDFVDLEPGDYIVEETQPADYLDVSDRDESPDGDAGDSDTTVDNFIAVTTTPGEADMDNDFIEEGLTSIWGDVSEDVDGDGAGDLPISGVTITLKDASGTVLETALTDADGKYDFTGLPAGDYLVEETQPTGFSDVSDRDESADGDAGDSDTTVDNSIAVTTTPTEADMDNDFIEEKLASISGSVLEDVDNDDAGDKPIAGVTILLKDAAGNTVASDVTDSNGIYEFLNIAPGTYTLMQMQPDGYVDVSDEDATPDPDGGNDPQDNSIPVILAAGENDDDNNFIEEQLVSIGSTVFEDVNDNGVQDAGEPGIAGVPLAIFEDADMDGLPDNGNPVGQDVTDANGNYYLGGLEPGKYVVIVQAPSGILNTSSTNNGADDGVDGDDNGFQPLGSGTPSVSASITLTPDTEPINEAGAGGNLESINGDQDDNGDMTIDFGFFAPGSIGDFVWFDIDGDGFQDPDEPGLQGVTVNLLDQDGNIVNTTTSGANGEFLFAGVAPGTYIVEFITPSGYTEVISAGTDLNDGSNSDYDPLTGRTAPIVIASGINELDLDAGFNLILDVSLVSFTGRYLENRDLNAISWITSSEINTDFFVLERAIDNGEFEAIEKVDAKGNGSTDALYSHDDTDIAISGIYNYRLKQISNDGTAIYSDIVSINVRRSEVSDPSVKVFPNPAYDFVNVEIVKGQSDVVSVKMFDLTGKVMTLGNVNVVDGSTSATLQIPVENLPKAAYILRINIGDQVFAKKITLVN